MVTAEASSTAVSQISLKDIRVSWDDEKKDGQLDLA